MIGMRVRGSEDYGNNDEPWFVDKDGASVLGYAKPLNAVAMHVEIEDSLK